ncbi:MAG: competence/damage-inducible protein A [Candidatus Omnitrophica bacterium]|nr:competence/damage-inducible protein A [Candidatus Omnitrophota bacterium]
MNPTAAIVVIGNEILSGTVSDTNAQFLIKELRELGIKLGGIFVIPDNWKTISAIVRRLEPLFDIVFTMGGIGPTHDDVTLKGVADGLRACLKRNAKYEELLRKFHGNGTNEAVLKMAEMPAEAELVFPEDVQIPVIKVRNFYVFPGEPELFKKQFLAMKEKLRAPSFYSKIIYLNAYEEEIAAILEQAQNQFPGTEIGSYPDYRNKEYKVRVVIDSADERLNQKAADYILEKIPRKFVVKVQ